MTGCAGKSDTETGSTATSSDVDTGPAPTCDELRWHGGSMLIDTQSGIDAFCPTYNAIEGDLSIHLGSAEDTIVELDGVQCLCEVTGSMEILHLSTVEGLRRFPGIQYTRREGSCTACTQ